MAVFQPLASSLHDVSEAELKGTTHVLGPDVRRVHMALDACAGESGSMRFEEALSAELPGDAGHVWLLGSDPSPAMSQLISLSPGARDAFGEALGLPVTGRAPRGRLTVTGGRIEEPPGTVGMSAFLSMLERDPQTTPSSIERLFDDLQSAKEAKLVVMDAGSIGLTRAGREMILDAGSALDAVSEGSIASIDRYAQEVADGRMTFKEALEALGEDLGLALPKPGEEMQDNEVGLSGALVRTPTADLRPIVEAARDIPEAHRLDVLVVGLSSALVDLGVDENQAAERVRNDLRLLRLFGASLSHGLPNLEGARRRLVPDHEAILDLFRVRLTPSMTAPFLLERLDQAEESAPEVVDEPATPKAQGWLTRLLRRLGIMF